ncbi:Tumor necrosis factor receptor superfamily member 14 Herpes virus entry mediator A [Channa argus]|uniref:Tumor necrosis factor receptor superfamily member 14 Herpes virus entry mediator A n=1 Tax=Channa argus TaxID=215402 RepID=A0A6G1Q1V8_CHAAH|nr:Tumor necrosis factor receptor superfamily member 14 Herpes virus entry mediator A [Channa argus]
MYATKIKSLNVSSQLQWIIFTHSKMFFMFLDVTTQQTSSQISVRCCLQPIETIDLIFKMTLRTSVTVSSFSILVMNIFSGHCLTCHRAEYLIGNECCPMCPAGSRVKIDSTEFRSTSCLSCLEGTYMDQPTGLKHCLSCTNCDSDSGLKTKTSCTTTSDAVCEPLEGFYCVDSTEDTCVRAHRHKSCEPGQYISRKGTSSSDTECSDCTDGTFSDGTFPVCQPHTQCDLKNLQLIKAGTASADAECEKNSLFHTGIVIGAVVCVIVLISIIGAVFVYKKKINVWEMCPTKDRKGNEDNDNQEPSEWRREKC